MPVDTAKAPYAASCNPPRRAKLPRAAPPPASANPDIPPTSQAPQPRALLPRRPVPAKGGTATDLNLDLHHPSSPTTPSIMNATPVPVSTPPPGPAITPAAPAPSKRGRKPGPLSRTQREAQRRLNHSIIEKARRTKINDALATLRQLVPVDYGRAPAPVHEDSDDESDDEDCNWDEGKGKNGGKGKGVKQGEKGKGKGGKKEEKEKEFKLEILVRTVSFLQDLLERVRVLEGGVSGTASPQAAPAPCSNCAAREEGTNKRKRSSLSPVDEEEDEERPAIRRRTHSLHISPPPTNVVGDSVPQQQHHQRSEQQPSPEQQQQEQPPTPPTSHPTPPTRLLPSISSWISLPIDNSVIDPSLLPPSTTDSVSPKGGSDKRTNSRSPPSSTGYLPSPPSSTHFDPIRTSQVPPALSLGPVMMELPGQTSSGSGYFSSGPSVFTSSSSSSYSSISSSTTHIPRTPEDENAASLLLQIRASASSSSPQFRPVASPRAYPSESPRAYPASSPRMNPSESSRMYPTSSPQVHPASSPRVYPMSSPKVNPAHSDHWERFPSNTTTMASSPRFPGGYMDAQTPGSLLGLNQPVRRGK
ncbi:hypothetical protein BDQ12DRAFT_729575 [Crucibulum laeve]|uniref:BHLH domain-containing protein n=1 Tax=Crucibulum laeve TaxID=68775 RepID=A0A5C3LEX8_9AGAR|nr:hypothetical protein BDQ12DRAFT_729575 [Crucibulum laeve]